MRPLTRAGFTAAELVVVLALLGIISLVSFRLLDAQRRIYHDHLARIELRRNLRLASAFLPSVLRPLGANGGDIVAMGPSFLTYRAVRSTSFICAAPAPPSLAVTVSSSPLAGTELPDVSRQWFLLFAESSPDSADDDAWLAVDADSQDAGPLCPGGEPGITLGLSGVDPAELQKVTPGAPLQGYVLERLTAYSDGSGDWWLGLQQHQKATGLWASIQPVSGPLAAAGLQFAFFDTTGIVTTRTDAVARIQVTLRARTEQRLWAGGAQYGTASLVTQIALRNNHRW
jgi:prepilin-type N-terminal cleavage/methylation domain-containing protein